MKNRSLNRVWLLLLWPLGCLALSPEAQKCFLYPVPEGESSPEFLLKKTSNTVITVNNVDFKKRGLSTIFLEHQCLVQLVYNEAPTTGDEQCPILSTNDEYAHVFIRRLEEGVGVRLKEGLGALLPDPHTDELERKIHLNSKATLIVRANNSNINVAYDCPEKSFQFEKATIHKTLGENLQGSLLFCGKVLPGAEDKGYINIVRGSSGWNMNSFVYLTNVNDPAWRRFNVSVTLRKSDNNYRGIITVHYDPSPRLLLETNPFVFPSPDLFLQFENTRSMRWAIIRLPQATCPAPPGEPSSSTATPSSPSGSPDYIQDGKLSVWWIVALGAAAALLIFLLLLLTANICRRRKRASEAPVPPNPSTAQCDDNLSDHEYDYIDIDQLRVSEAHSQTDQQDRRKSHNSINSIYGWDEKDPIDVHK